MDNDIKYCTYYRFGGRKFTKSNIKARWTRIFRSVSYVYKCPKVYIICISNEVFTLHDIRGNLRR